MLTKLLVDDDNISDLDVSQARPIQACGAVGAPGFRSAYSQVH